MKNDRNIGEGLGELKQQRVFNLQVVFNLQNSSTKIASQLF